MEKINNSYLLRKIEETQKDLNDLINEVKEKQWKTPTRLVLLQKKLLIIHTWIRSWLFNS